MACSDLSPRRVSGVLGDRWRAIGVCHVAAASDAAPGQSACRDPLLLGGAAARPERPLAHRAAVCWAEGPAHAAVSAGVLFGDLVEADGPLADRSVIRARNGELRCGVDIVLVFGTAVSQQRQLLWCGMGMFGTTVSQPSNQLTFSGVLTQPGLHVNLQVGRLFLNGRSMEMFW